jgi:hypothetical protein
MALPLKSSMANPFAHRDPFAVLQVVGDSQSRSARPGHLAQLDFGTVVFRRSPIHLNEVVEKLTGGAGRGAASVFAFAFGAVFA